MRLAFLSHFRKYTPATNNLPANYLIYIAAVKLTERERERERSRFCDLEGEIELCVR